MQFFTALFSVLALAVSTTATPVPIAERSELVVVNPYITSPSEGSIWPVGTRQLVTWNTDDIPPDGKNNTGRILLGYFDDDDDSSEHLDYAHPLAQGFLLTAGSQGVTVPGVVPKDTYFIVLMGDSGNISPKISIVN